MLSNDFRISVWWPTNNCDDCLMTAKLLSDDCPVTVFQLVQWLSNDCSMTVWWLPEDSMMTVWWLWWLSNDYLMTVWWHMLLKNHLGINGIFVLWPKHNLGTLNMNNQSPNKYPHQSQFRHNYYSHS